MRMNIMNVLCMWISWSYFWTCIYIYKVFFNLVNPKKGTFPSGKMNDSNFEYLNILWKELNVNKFTEIILFLRKEEKTYVANETENCFFLEIISIYIKMSRSTKRFVIFIIKRKIEKNEIKFFFEINKRINSKKYKSHRRPTNFKIFLYSLCTYNKKLYIYIYIYIRT